MIQDFMKEMKDYMFSMREELDRLKYGKQAQSSSVAKDLGFTKDPNFTKEPNIKISLEEDQNPVVKNILSRLKRK
jgi:hypothetical protein